MTPNEKTNSMKHYDIAIIGGGINGAGIARDAASRGLKVVLCEQNDLASGTSSYSSKLIHGGLRYLEYHDFRLVREGLQERERLLKIAPHLIYPLEFIMPHQPQMRPAWLIRLGLFLYDHLAKRLTLPSSHSIQFKEHLSGKPLLEKYHQGFSYYDCATDDARLVIANAKSARDLGATILTNTECKDLQPSDNKQWQLHLYDKLNSRDESITARVVVNATGPWLNEFNKHVKLSPSPSSVDLVKGSHIIIAKFYQGNHAYLLQNFDKRAVFVIPYQEDFCLIGTTDIAYSAAPGALNISEEEINYLCRAVNSYFKQPISSKDILHSYSGIRALQHDEVTDPAAITRDYKLELLNQETAPYLNIVGGKLTTYRRLAEQAVNLLAPIFGLSSSNWTDTATLCGGELANHTPASYFKSLNVKYSWLPTQILKRYIQQYGNACEIFIEKCLSLADLGENFGHGLYEKEINYLISAEWAVTTDDILWRRTKLGLKFTATEKNQLETFLFSHQNLNFQKK